MPTKKHLAILGIRGIPASHGGFETFAERLALYLTEKDWRVTVYCQESGRGDIQLDEWCGVKRVRIPVEKDGPVGTMLFDWKSINHVIKSGRKDLVLTLGYNTAIFCARYRIAGITNVINMDGLEWKRDKWALPHKVWLWLNERAGCLLGNRLVADHPRIEDHLATRVRRNKITMIPYGADEIVDADVHLIRKYGLEPKRYLIVIARPEPENSLLEIVKAFSRVKRNFKLVLLGKYDPSIAFHRMVLEAASGEVIIPGAIYDRAIVEALRSYSRLYVHGHRVGGTNPSLVEALGAGSAVLAHDNQFNRWVAGSAALYFDNESTCAAALDRLLIDDEKIAELERGAKLRFSEAFTWSQILQSYEGLLKSMGD